jgi:hypothetical protein
VGRPRRCSGPVGRGRRRSRSPSVRAGADESHCSVRKRSVWRTSWRTSCPCRRAGR